MIYEGFSPWISGDLSPWSTLLSGKQPTRFKKESMFYLQGDAPQNVYLISSGRVRITSYQESGIERQIYIAEPGCLIGENSAIRRENHTTSAVSIVDSSVFIFTAQEFINAMKNDFTIAFLTMNIICRKHNVLFEQLLEVSFEQSLERISQCLVNLVNQYGKTVSNGIKISIKFTQQDVANITGISRVTVSNTFNLLVNAGTLKKIDGFIVIHDLSALQEYAHGEETV